MINNNRKPVEFKSKDILDYPNARACLISGNPGIDNTTVVRLIAKLKGYRIYELNASDQRNKAIIYSILGFLLDNTTLRNGEIQYKNPIIMDEVDGTGGKRGQRGNSCFNRSNKENKSSYCMHRKRQAKSKTSVIN